MRFGMAVFLDGDLEGLALFTGTGLCAAQSADKDTLDWEQYRHLVDCVLLVSVQHLQQHCTG